jgi:tetratricopeptide (TPR) repeat protein
MTRKRLLFATILAIMSPLCFAHGQEAEDRAAIRRGNEFVAQANYEMAIREYERVPPTAAHYAQALYNIGVCHYELWHTDRALDFYARAIAAAKNNYPKASYARGVALEDLGRFAAAKEAYKKAINSSHGVAPAQFRLGLLNAQDGDHAAAMRLFKEAIRRPGEHLSASHNNLGVVLAQLGRLAEAEHEFKTALRLSDGAFEDAEQNLKLCREALVNEKTRTASLKSLTLSCGSLYTSSERVQRLTRANVDIRN